MICDLGTSVLAIRNPTEWDSPLKTSLEINYIRLGAPIHIQ
jgi:hypothetical protein